MANQRMQKQKLLEILRLLQQEADNEHPLKCSEIIARLSQKGMSAERKSVYSDIDILRQAGWDICYQKNQGYWLKRRYTLAQLKLLSDAVGSLTILSADQARQFNALLLEECSRYQQPQLSPLLPEYRESGADVLANIDQILKALRENVEIQFRYFDITVHKQKRYRRQSQTYQLFPYALIRENQRYYCVCYSFHHQGFSHYRLDKMEQIQLQSEPLPRIPFDLKEYTARSFGMYASEPVNMTLRFDLSLANTVFDRFGQDVMITRITDQDFDVNLTLSAAPPFLGWLFQFGQKVRILQPQSLKDQMREAAEATLRSLDEESAG